MFVRPLFPISYRIFKGRELVFPRKSRRILLFPFKVPLFAKKNLSKRSLGPIGALYEFGNLGILGIWEFVGVVSLNSSWGVRRVGAGASIYRQ